MSDLEGEVSKRLYAAGSKSEHRAVMLTTADAEYQLRREGGNPFQDDVLDTLVGKYIRCSGRALSERVYLMSDWEEIPRLQNS